MLGSLGRTHVPANVERAVAAVRAAGIATFNLDLIYGAAGESLDDWRTTLDGASPWRSTPPHVSAYALTVEAGTPLGRRPERHPDDDDLADKYELADDLLTAAGLANYEVSATGRVPGHECRHNRLYWQQGDYRGFGCAAHSHRAGRRWWNVRTPERYRRRCAPASRPRRRGRTSTTRPAGSRDCSWPCACATACPLPRSTSMVWTVWSRRTAPCRLTRHGRLLANEVSMRLR